MLSATGSDAACVPRGSERESSKPRSWRQFVVSKIGYVVVFVVGVLVGRVDIFVRSLAGTLYEGAVIAYALETPRRSFNSKLGILENTVFLLEVTRNTDLCIPTLVRLLDHPDRLVRFTASDFLANASNPPSMGALLRLTAISQDPGRDRADRDDAATVIKIIQERFAKWSRKEASSG
ncbi:MAG: hypothetical protein JWP89_5994 [Schlesneria sp.]|nr:hypothetical protein [Schlesneria sp.]